MNINGVYGLIGDSLSSIDSTAKIELSDNEINLEATNVLVNGQAIGVAQGYVTNPLSSNLNCNDKNLSNVDLINGLSLETINSDLNETKIKTFHIEPILSLDSTKFLSNVIANKFITSDTQPPRYLMSDGTELANSGNNAGSNIFLYNNNLTISAPASAGQIRFNNVVIADTTIIYISHLTRDGTDIDPFLALITQLSILYIQDQDNSANYCKFNVNATPTITPNSYVTVNVTYLDGGGTGTTNFPAGMNIFLSIFSNDVEIDTRLSNVETKTQLITANSTRTTLSNSSQFRLTTFDNFFVTLDVGLDTFTKFNITGTQITAYIPMSMNNSKLNGIPTPINNDDAVNKLYVDTNDGLKLNLTGGNLSGELNMGNNKISLLSAPTISTDGATKGYVDTAISGGAGLSPYFRQVNQLALVTTNGLLETTMTTTPTFGSYTWADTAVGQSRKWSIQGFQNRGTFAGVYTIRFKTGTTLNVEWVLPSQGPGAVSNLPFTLDITTVRGTANSLSYYAKFETPGASAVGYYLLSSQNQTGGVAPLNTSAQYNITIQSNLASCNLSFAYVEVMALIK